jgi:hypothetical protein
MCDEFSTDKTEDYGATFLYKGPMYIYTFLRRPVD